MVDIVTASWLKEQQHDILIANVNELYEDYFGPELFESEHRDLGMIHYLFEDGQPVDWDVVVSEGVISEMERGAILVPGTVLNDELEAQPSFHVDDEYFISIVSNNGLGSIMGELWYERMSSILAYSLGEAVGLSYCGQEDCIMNMLEAPYGETEVNLEKFVNDIDNRNRLCQVHGKDRISFGQKL